MFKTLLITIAIVSMVSYLGCKDPGGTPISVTPPADETPLTKDDSVMANAHLVRDAAEAWAALSGGNYPRDTREELPDGRTLVSFLPNGELLVNPYTSQRTSPLSAMGVNPGQVGYDNLVSGPPYGYKINGVGSEAGVNIIMLHLDPNEP